jgi:hypothetical protein
VKPPRAAGQLGPAQTSEPGADGLRAWGWYAEYLNIRIQASSCS